MMKDKKTLNFIEEMEKVADSIIKVGHEPQVLSEIQQDIHKYDISDKDHFNIYIKQSYSSEDIENAIVHLEQIRMATEMLLLRSWKTFRADKFTFIFLQH